MKISAKTFDKLTTKELYGILQLRSEVFVVEQNCVYQDVDNKDYKAIHLIGQKANQVVAYTRVFKPGDYFEKTAIGRVVVKASERKYGYGKIIMQATLDYIEQDLKETQIELSAQTYLIKFYNSLGFLEEGIEYLEDDIPHIKMVKT
ncbi:GNAT family N-acetyltransferase [Croceitalea rosinachiae]|uniref:GNAT family N-acetyltransferase n=1 Tax=Croceitalea rosinachiae TaxID=3075596 RepID=A0ABU3A8R8_9FLAO|nr:GNAT family N-acetyltransferase [Croceitalea sp. F388]MDT0606288.1 GNAT family N-acetyltransferase [Croceitalea sp. F388]